ncbi:MAG TPA: hypothetical protein VET23_09610 [Chitinophagaceae bacterium]|nr:hypothetical protein [Chitinophagaceae bacterium]
MKFIMTIDTEGDNQWDHGCELSVKNIKAIPRFQELCTKYGIKPTYLVTSEVCNDDFAKELFKEFIRSDRAEIGAHLHSWTTPPFLDKEGYKFNDVNHAFLSELPIDLLADKIKNLTEQIETSFGTRPLSFRSGRYGFNENVAKTLIENSYLVDSSVTPFYNWSSHQGLPGGKGGPNYFDKSPNPYHYHFNHGSLLEIPMTILPTRYPLNAFPEFAKYYYKNVQHNILLRILRKLLLKRQPLWLSPFEWMSVDLLEEIVKEANKLKLPFILMWFHSSELMAGCSIYRRDEEAIERLFALLENFFILLNRNNIGSVTLKEAASNCKTGESASEVTLQKHSGALSGIGTSD